MPGRSAHLSSASQTEPATNRAALAGDMCADRQAVIWQWLNPIAVMVNKSRLAESGGPVGIGRGSVQLLRHLRAAVRRQLVDRVRACVRDSYFDASNIATEGLEWLARDMHLSAYQSALAA